MPAALFRINNTRPRDPAIDAWFHARPGELASIARHWFEAMRLCGDEVRETLHDGCPVACLGDAPFACVNVFTAHVIVAFFHGASLPDPSHLLEGAGRFMRHVKLKPGNLPDPAALAALIHSAWDDIQARVENG